MVRTVRFFWLGEVYPIVPGPSRHVTCNLNHTSVHSLVHLGSKTSFGAVGVAPIRTPYTLGIIKVRHRDVSNANYDAFLTY